MRKVDDIKFGCTGGGAIHQDTYMPPPRENEAKTRPPAPSRRK